MRSISLTYPVVQEQIISGLEKAGLPLIPFLGDVNDLLKVPTEYLGELGGGIFNFASVIFGGIFSFLLIIVFSFYIATQERGIESFLRLLAPVAYEPYVIDLWDRSQRKLGRWLRAQLLLGAIVGVLIFFVLTFLGVRHALFFAALAAIFEIIPVVGPIKIRTPTMGAAFFDSSLLGVLVLAMYVIIQQVESHVIVPVV